MHCYDDAVTWDLIGYFFNDFRESRFAPPDAIARAMRVIGIIFVVLALLPGPFERMWRGLLRSQRRYYLSLVAIAAALGSWAYLEAYLRGGPRIVDGTTYMLQARSLAQGHFTWPLEFPSASFRGRFLYSHDGHIGGIFPPGYPLLLSIGAFFGMPLVVGPLLGAAITIATYALTKELASELHPPAIEPAARGAALFSLFSFAQRYHTADTMSHGAVALAVSLALFAVLRAVRTRDVRAFVLCGASIGYVASTRLVSALPVGITCALVAVVSTPTTARPWALRVRECAAIAVGTLPGIALLLASQHAITGHAFESTQLAYYARSDGPPGCFRFGFGAGIGCLFEHGDFVRHRLPNGHTLAASLETQAWRMKAHMLDPLNVEVLAVMLVPFAVVRGLMRAPTRFALLLLALQFGAYLPFYFDASYPGGGARLFADVLPVEHALFALTFASARFPIATLRAIGCVIGLSLVGFAYRGAKEHVLLRERDGGRPAFEPAVVKAAGIERGLLFVDTDAAYGLAYIPRTTPDRGLAVTHYRGDAHDYLVWKRLGSPPAYHYVFGERRSTIEPFTPPASSRFEAEREWPPLAQEDGFVAPYWPACASNQSGLALIPAASKHATATIDLPIARNGRYSISPRFVDRGQKARGTLVLRSRGGNREVKHTWSWQDGNAERCPPPDPALLDLEFPGCDVELTADGGEVALDAIDVVAVSPP